MFGFLTPFRFLHIQSIALYPGTQIFCTKDQNSENSLHLVTRVKCTAIFHTYNFVFITIDQFIFQYVIRSFGCLFNLIKIQTLGFFLIGELWRFLTNTGITLDLYLQLCKEGRERRKKIVRNPGILKICNSNANCSLTIMTNTRSTVIVTYQIWI